MMGYTVGLPIKVIDTKAHEHSAEIIKTFFILFTPFIFSAFLEL